MDCQRNQIAISYSCLYIPKYILGDDRGPVLEVIVSRTNFISSHTDKKVRVVGLSTALANARDLADWLGIKQVQLNSGKFSELIFTYFLPLVLKIKNKR